MSDMSTKWKCWKYELKKSSYDPTMTINEIVASQIDDRVETGQFRTLMEWFVELFYRKRVKYEAKCADIGYGFLPFSFSTFGKLEKDAVTLLERIRKFSMAQDIGTRAAIHIFSRISFAIAKGVGVQIVSWDLYDEAKNMKPLLEKSTKDLSQ
ncbi:hypothetical protein Tco_0997223 [Tanacetum coccineum]